MTYYIHMTYLSLNPTFNISYLAFWSRQNTLNGHYESYEEHH